MSDETPFADAIRILEASFYTDEELARWMLLPQPLLDHSTPIQLLANGRKNDLLAVIKRLDDEVYI